MTEPVLDAQFATVAAPVALSLRMRSELLLLTARVRAAISYCIAAASDKCRQRLFVCLSEWQRGAVNCSCAVLGPRSSTVPIYTWPRSSTVPTYTGAAVSTYTGASVLPWACMQHSAECSNHINSGNTTMSHSEHTPTCS